MSYRANRFVQKTEGGFEALGSLTIKDPSTPVTLEFTLSQEAGKVVLDGVAKLDRVSLQVGIGQWSDTRWIGQFVTVSVHVEAVEAP